MVFSRVLGVREVKGTMKIEINPKRIVLWTLIFSNAFFVPYFFAKLFRFV